MIANRIKDIKISAVTATVPLQYIPTDSCKPDLGEETIEKFKKMSGILGHYLAVNSQTASDLCFAAAKEIIYKKNIRIEDIGALIFVTQTPDYNVPATSCVLHYRLGLSKDCIAFDVNLGCSGYVNGINILSSIISCSNIKYALLLAGDTQAKEKSRKIKLNVDNSFKLLFGDAGTATLLERCDGAAPIDAVMRTDGSGFRNIIRPYNQWRNPDMPEKKIMDDIAVFNFTIAEVPKILKEFMAEHGTTPNDYDDLVLHQANFYILKQIAKRTGFSIEKMPISLDLYGNTSSASIPLTLVKKYGEINDGRMIRPLMCGFGVGLSWGVVSAEVNVDDILPVIHSDEFFDDGFGAQE
ncbi:3-oxoacyl-ACP synthase III family protein [Synergistes jonesii]|uniref:3-oxoacyl-ACP synthase III family protein n=1 Tax=Synergistes jonesii TaxID=2754 RepID=UPI002430033D|nr:ketoacyl-ACP synthase III [Synergistes jonesii]